MSCCTTIIPVGCFSQCDTILETSIVGLADEDVTIAYTFNGVRLTTEAETITGEPIEIINVFNEFSDVVFQIIRPDGSLYPACYQLSIR